MLSTTTSPHFSVVINLEPVPLLWTARVALHDTVVQKGQLPRRFMHIAIICICVSFRLIDLESTFGSTALEAIVEAIMLVILMTSSHRILGVKAYLE